MQDSITVQVHQTYAHLDEELPNLGFWQLAPHLFLEIEAQISVFAQLHDDVDLFVRSEGF